jgi:hypothetical protein
MPWKQRVRSFERFLHLSLLLAGLPFGGPVSFWTKAFATDNMFLLPVMKKGKLKNRKPELRVVRWGPITTVWSAWQRCAYCDAPV